MTITAFGGPRRGRGSALPPPDPNVPWQGRPGTNHGILPGRTGTAEASGCALPHGGQVGARGRHPEGQPALTRRAGAGRARPPEPLTARIPGGRAGAAIDAWHGVSSGAWSGAAPGLVRGCAGSGEPLSTPRPPWPRTYFAFEQATSTLIVASSLLVVSMSMVSPRRSISILVSLALRSLPAMFMPTS